LGYNYQIWIISKKVGKMMGIEEDLRTKRKMDLLDTVKDALKTPSIWVQVPSPLFTWSFLRGIEVRSQFL